MVRRFVLTAVCTLLIGLLLCSSGCSSIAQLVQEASPEDIFSSVEADLFGEHEQVYSTVTVTLPRHSGYHPIEDKTAYGTLTTESQRTAYAAIEDSVFRVTNEPGGSYGRYSLQRAYIPDLSSAEIFMVKEAVIADHPEAFWINGTYSLGQNLHDGNYLTLYTNFDYPSICSRMKSLEQAVASVLKEIPSGLSEYERELIIHNCLVRDTDYDEEAADLADYSYLDAATVYGTLVNRRALCGGYSYAAKLLLNRLGISCSTVKGISKNVGHMWNIVNIDGNWYHLDITWDDPIMLSADSIQRYDYFNVNDSRIRSDHDISENYSALTDELIIKQGGKGMNFFNFDMPECGSTEANYYYINALAIDGLDDAGVNKITDRMKQTDKSSEPLIYLMFSENLSAESVTGWLDSALVSAMSAANRSAAANGRPKISQCLRSSREDESSAWSNVHCIKLIFEE